LVQRADELSDPGAGGAGPAWLEAAIGEAIRRCNGAGFEEALWNVLRLASRADNLLVLAYRIAAVPLVLWRHAPHSQAFELLDSSYVAGAYLLDPVHELHLTGVPAGVYRLSEVAPDAFARSRFYEEYFRQTTILDEIDFIAHPRAGVTVAISVGRDAASGSPFSARDMGACRRLAPVVIALAERHWAELVAPPGKKPDVAAAMSEALKAHLGIRLTPRQAEVALLILRGHSSVSIALRLGVSRQTVKVFRRQLYRRCGISSQAELFSLLLPHLPETGA